MTGTLPPHGERRCYLRGCRRPECLDAHYRYMSRWRLDQQRGHRRRVPAGRTVDHITRLTGAGWSFAQIGTAAGCAHRTIAALVAGEHRTVATETERRVLAVPPGPPPSPRYVDAVGTMRRIRALAAIGHPFVGIGPAIGLHHSAVSRIACGEAPQVLASTARATAEVYRRWSARPGSSARARNHAARSGWPGPLAWDENIDDPDARPEADPGWVPLRGTRAEAEEIAVEVRHLAAAGIPVHEIAARVGRSESYVRQQLAGGHGPGWRQQGAAA